MRCEEVRNHWADIVNDAINEPLRSNIEKHLLACEPCRAEAEELKFIWAEMGSIPREEPTSATRARFETMLEAYENGLSHASSSNWWEGMNSWLSAWWPRQPVVQIALSLALLGIGIGAGLLFNQGKEPNIEISQLRGEMQEMRQLVVLSLMQQQSASERLKGVSWSHQIQPPDDKVLAALLDTLRLDASVNVRLAAIDALRSFGDERVVRQGVLRALTEQSSPLVQLALIDLMVELRETESIQTLRKMSADQELNESVRKRAEWGLQQLA